MKVIAAKNTKNLIKGKQYEVEQLNCYRGHPNEWYIDIIGLPNSFKLDSFHTLSGHQIKEERYSSNKDWYSEMNKLRGSEIGDIVVCVSKTLKTLTYGKYYTIANKKVNTDGKTVEISLEESPKGEHFYYSAWVNNFKLLPKNQKRDINIKLILDEEKVEEMVDYYDPIFEDIQKESMILNLINKSLKYLHETKLDASLQEIIEHKVAFENYITMEDVKNFDLKKIMKY